MDNMWIECDFKVENFFYHNSSNIFPHFIHTLFTYLSTSYKHGQSLLLSRVLAVIHLSTFPTNNTTKINNIFIYEKSP